MHSSGINIIALAPPEFAKNLLKDGERMSSVNSDIPYSLLSTLALTFQKVREGTLRVLNWADVKGIRDSVFLMHHWQDEKDILAEKLIRLKPRIACIGSFALNFPGAIEAAKMIRELSPDTLIVLGGRHVSETFWSEMQGNNFGIVQEHGEANVLRLMQTGIIPPIFDIVVSGEGRGIIPAIIGIVDSNNTPHEILKNLEQLKSTPGYWTIGTLQNGVIIYTQPTSYTPSDTTGDRSPYIYCGTDSVYFPVFQKSHWTAHVHSDSRGIPGNTCTQNCDFCSEAGNKSPTRKPHEKAAANRLYQRFQDIVEVADRENKVPSIFVEDSILCGGHWGALEHFCELLEGAYKKSEKMPGEWGCQFTVPIILSERGSSIIRRLKKYGLSYIYFGLESAKPEIAESIGKTKKSKQWSSECETAIASLTEIGIQTGTSNMFCMGETQQERMNQLKLIVTWQMKYRGNPSVYSLNLQTVHPGEWGDPGYKGPKPNYTKWGLDQGDPRSPIIQKIFGEAGIHHLKYPDELPDLKQFQEIKDFISHSFVNV